MFVLPFEMCQICKTLKLVLMETTAELTFVLSDVTTWLSQNKQNIQFDRSYFLSQSHKQLSAAIDKSNTPTGKSLYFFVISLGTLQA